MSGKFQLLEILSEELGIFIFFSLTLTSKIVELCLRAESPSLNEQIAGDTKDFWLGNHYILTLREPWSDSV